LTGLFAVTLLLLLSPIAQAELKVANVFSDHMVLQQEMPIRVWGWAKPGSTVVVGLSDLRVADATSLKAGDDGKWFVELKPRKAEGKTLKLQVTSGDETVEFKDILMGEVWICSGQSNMEWSVARSANPKEEIAAANYPMIRMFNVPAHVKQNTPQKDAQAAKWQICTPQTVAGFSACGYYFGRALNKELNVPIGLVGTNWGGTRIEPWTPPVGFAKVPQLKNISNAVASLDPTSEKGKAARAQYMTRVQAWTAQAEKNLAAGKEIGSAPQLAINPPGGATQIYNGMVAGLTPLSARGVIWYQGESNAGDGLKYNYMKEALVKGWRETFQNEDLSFYWVGLAGFGRGQTNQPAGGGWGPVREGQRRALRIPNTGMAVTTDIGHVSDIHPKNKQDIGQRLALWALAKNYGKDVTCSGPMYKSHEVKGNTVVVHFDHVGSGLMSATKGGTHLMDPVKATPGKALESFSIRDDKGAWHWATATIAGDTVVLKSDKVAKPTAVRYAYDSMPKVNFYNKEGLPAVPFTTVD
ncbi:MAG: sialate O-acetylesterase, partial [Phycisphaeraceae bacterium]